MPAPFIGAVEQLFRLNANDTADLANRLYAANVRAFNRVVNEQLAALGQPPTFRLTNSAELKELKRQATESARSIAKTYNEALANRVDAIVAAEGARGLNRRTLAKRLADWDAGRAGWKQESIRVTEAARVAQRAITTFVEASRIDDQARYVILPNRSDHDDPNDAVARSGELLDHAAMLALGLPAHVNERHAATLALPAGGVSTEALWMGG